MRKLLPITFFFFIPFALAGELSWSGSAGEPFRVEVSIPKDTVSVDETLELHAEVFYPPSHTVDTDKMRVNLLKVVGLSEPPFALKGETIKDIPEGGKKIVFKLEPLLEGVHFLSLYDIVFPPKNPEAHSPVTIVSDIFTIETTLPAVSKEYRGTPFQLLSLTERFPVTMTQHNRHFLLDNPEKLEQETERNSEIFQQKTLPWAEITGVFLFSLILLIARMQPARKPDLEKQLKKRTLSARKKAIKDLSAIKDSNLPEKREYNHYYVLLTGTVRSYIEESTHVKATTQTTKEFLESMASSPKFNEETKKLLKEFLIEADRVKFAVHQPSREECRKAHQIASQFIEHSSEN